MEGQSWPGELCPEGRPPTPSERLVDSSVVVTTTTISTLVETVEYSAFISQGKFLFWHGSRLGHTQRAGSVSDG
jgi:hypothetical protein